MRLQTGGVQLSLPTGSCLLRTLSVEGLSRREAESAIQLWADESLPESAEHYYLHTWSIDPMRVGLAALPKAMLRREREALQLEGKKITTVQVPELTPPTDTRSALLFWHQPSTVMACYWQDGTLQYWQSFPASMPTEHLLEQLSTVLPLKPYWIGIDQHLETRLRSNRVAGSIARHWRGADLQTIPDANREGQRFARFFSAGPRFDHFLREARYQPASPADKWRLGLAAASMAGALLILGFSELEQRDREIQTLRKLDTVESPRARRSEQVAARSSQTLQDVYDIRALSVERSGALAVLKSISDALPPDVRFSSVTIDRSGNVEIDGLARSEIDISTFLRQLNRDSAVTTARLEFAEKSAGVGKSGSDQSDQDSASELRFRLAARLAQNLLTLPGSETSDSDSDGQL